MQYWDLNGTEITASDGYLMGILVDNVYSNSKPYGKIAKLKTSAVFESNFFSNFKVYSLVMTGEQYMTISEDWI